MKVLIFGAGDFGMRYYEKVRNSEDIAVVGFLDNNERIQGQLLYDKYRCCKPEAIDEIEYDRVVIANSLSEETRAQLFAQLVALGVSERDIEYYPRDVIEKEVGEDPRIWFVRQLSAFFSECEIAGNVAECGVNDGEFARYINRYFFDKKLYLFDTFEGFAAQDIEVERAFGEEGFLTGQHNHVGGWNHSVDKVMSRMVFPDRVEIRKGWVPESFDGVDDTFCFVNLDMDLYQPMLAALRFFWDKMSVGGILLLHDYEQPELPGVKKAVRDFEAGLGRRIPKSPMCGSLVIIKG